MDGQTDINEILKIRREKLKELQDAGMDPYAVTTYDRKNTSREILEHFDRMEGSAVSIAGRLMSKRVMGKASFSDVSDRRCEGDGIPYSKG